MLRPLKYLQELVIIDIIVSGFVTGTFKFDKIFETNTYLINLSIFYLVNDFLANHKFSG